MNKLSPTIELRAIALFVGLLLLTGPLVAQTTTIGTVDFYGLRTVSLDSVRGALMIGVGDPQPDGASQAAIKRRLEEIPGVIEASISLICCQDGMLNLYVGIAEDSNALLRPNPPPDGSVRLPNEIMSSAADFERELLRAVQAGRTQDDFSQGHSLMSDSAVRAVQERFIVYADGHFDRLREVLRDSADPEHRAIAARVLGYARDKRVVVADLVHAVRDPDSGVRNDATRALGAIAFYAGRNSELEIRIPAEPFVEMLNSVHWTDRNKGGMILSALSENADGNVRTLLRERALESIVEMARWDGAWQMGVFLLARAAGFPDEEWQEVLAGDNAQRRLFVERALERIHVESGADA